MPASQAGSWRPNWLSSSSIDRTYPLTEIVEAHPITGANHKRGNVVITV